MTGHTPVDTSWAEHTEHQHLDQTKTGRRRSRKQTKERKTGSTPHTRHWFCLTLLIQPPFYDVSFLIPCFSLFFFFALIYQNLIHLSVLYIFLTWTKQRTEGRKLSTGPCPREPPLSCSPLTSPPHARPPVPSVENPGISYSDIFILIPDSRAVYDLIFTLFILLTLSR